MAGRDQLQFDANAEDLCHSFHSAAGRAIRGVDELAGIVPADSVGHVLNECEATVFSAYKQWLCACLQGGADEEEIPATEHLEPFALKVLMACGRCLFDASVPRCAAEEFLESLRGEVAESLSSVPDLVSFVWENEVVNVEVLKQIGMADGAKRSWLL